MLHNLYRNSEFTQYDWVSLNTSFLQNYWTFRYSFHFQQKKEQNHLYWICAVSSMAKVAAINVFLVCKIFGLKIQSCKIFDKFHVWVWCQLSSASSVSDTVWFWEHRSYVSCPSALSWDGGLSCFKILSIIQRKYKNGECFADQQHCPDHLLGHFFWDSLGQRAVHLQDLESKNRYQCLQS